MKCVKLYNILSDYQIAKSASGQWFDRVYQKNGFGHTWSKWTPMKPIASITRRTVTFENLNGNIITQKFMEVYFGNDRIDIKSTLIPSRKTRCRLPY